LKNFSIPVPGNPFLKFLPVISLFVFAAFFIPLAGSFFLFLLPMILFVSGAVHGLIKTATTFLISFLLALILAVLFHLNVPAIAVFAIGVAGLMITGSAARNFSIEKTIIYPSLFIIAAVCCYFIYTGYLLGTDPWQLVQKFVAEIIKEQMKIYGQLPLAAEDINILKASEKDMINDFTQRFPAMVIISAVLLVWINVLMGKKILEKTGISYPRFTMLARWKAPDAMIWIFIVSGAFYLGTIYFVPKTDLNSIGWNVLLVVCFAYLLQGISVFSFLFQVKNTPPFFRSLFYFLIAVLPILMLPILTIGLFDIWIDFRKFFQKDQTTA
jgi:uncharacterized protein YybS (DUF2232 family)